MHNGKKKQNQPITRSLLYVLYTANVSVMPYGRTYISNKIPTVQKQYQLLISAWLGDTEHFTNAVPHITGTLVQFQIIRN